MDQFELKINQYTGLLEPEIWKPVVGYEALYIVSNYGRLKVLPRIMYCGPRKTPRQRLEREMSLCKNRSGYYGTMLTKNGESKSIAIHRLVAETFIPNPGNLAQVNHKHGAKDCNYAWELEWMSSADNKRHAHRTGLIVMPKGEDASCSKLTNLYVKIIKEALKLRFKRKEIARHFNVSLATIKSIASGRSWSTIS